MGHLTKYHTSHLCRNGSYIHPGQIVIDLAALNLVPNSRLIHSCYTGTGKALEHIDAAFWKLPPSPGHPEWPFSKQAEQEWGFFFWGSIFSLTSFGNFRGRYSL